MKIANINNLSLVSVAMERLVNRLDGLPGLGVLSDAFTKTVAANAKVMPETSKLATAIEVLELFGEVIKEKYPQHLQAYVELVEPLGVEIEKKYR